MQKRKIYGLSLEQSQIFCQQLKRQIQQAEKLGGWDESALAAYYIHIHQHLRQMDPFVLLQRAAEQERAIGSTLYVAMLTASNYSAIEKIHLVIKQLDGFLDEWGFLQLRKIHYDFAACLAPHHRFYEVYAYLVREAYRQGGEYRRLDSAAIHQFRTRLDAQMLAYIRNSFVGATDLIKLKHYERSVRRLGKTLHPIRSLKGWRYRLFTREPARYHNKYLEQAYPGKKNDKLLTYNRHGEFIVGPTGQFVTEWDIWSKGTASEYISEPAYYFDRYQADPQQLGKLINTASFNYAKRGGHSIGHQRLDVNPGNNKYGLEPELKRQLKDVWKTPSLEVYQAR